MDKRTYSKNNKIVELMQVPAEQYNLAWLQESLQAAVDLELATLPVYLCGQWSIQSGSGPVYDQMNNIILEEMLHLGLACNMLTAIGGTPQISSNIPTYPGPLPGGVNPNLTVTLAGLTLDQVYDVYMAIEYPENGPVVPNTNPAPKQAPAPSHPTIGEFYDAILAAFQQVNPTFTGQHQLTVTFNSLNQTHNEVFPINSLTDVQNAIEVIKEQGEGTSTSPLDEDADFAHYYRFAEIWNGKMLVQVNGQWQYAGDAITIPDVYPMAPIPAGGYTNVPASVQSDLDAFNQTFAAMLDGLQAAWNGTGSIDSAIGKMFSLPGLAQTILQIPLDSNNPSLGNYGPNFVLPS